MMVGWPRNEATRADFCVPPITYSIVRVYYRHTVTLDSKSARSVPRLAAFRRLNTLYSIEGSLGAQWVSHPVKPILRPKSS